MCGGAEIAPPDRFEADCDEDDDDDADDNDDGGNGGGGGGGNAKPEIEPNPADSAAYLLSDWNILSPALVTLAAVVVDPLILVPFCRQVCICSAAKFETNIPQFIQ